MNRSQESEVRSQKARRSSFFILASVFWLLSSGPACASDVQDLIFFGDTRPLLIRLHVEIDGRPFRAVWQDYIKELLQYLDRDGDGILTKAEAERGPAPQFLFSPNEIFIPQPGAVNFRFVDTNPVDGKATLEELAEFYGNQGGGVFQALLNQMQNPSAKVLNESLLSRLDTDKDGKMSKEELAAARTTLIPLDIDEDEMVSAGELGPRPYLQEMPNGGFVVNQTVGTAALGENNALLAMVGPDSRDRLARQILRRYGAASKTPTAQPSGRVASSARRTRAQPTIARQDTRLDADLFDRLDTSKDAKLDTNELARFADRPADAELMVRLGKKDKPDAATLDIASSAEAGKAAARKNQDGGIVLESGNARIDFRVNAAPSAAAGGGVDSRQFLKQQFQAADTDNNGYLELKEVQQNPYFRTSFKTLDTDADGKLFEKELAAYLDRFGKLQGKALTSRTSALVTEGLGLFELLDVNHDSRLTLRELHQAPNVINALDRDKDGKLAGDEIIRSFQISLSRGSAGTGQGRAVPVVAYGMANAASATPSAGPVWFRKMDRNRDGDVSPREFLGAKNDFRKLDSDGDQLISVDEAKRAAGNDK